MNSWNVELLVSLPFRHGECCAEVIEKVATGDFFCSEAHHMR